MIVTAQGVTVGVVCHIQGHTSPVRNSRGEPIDGATGDVIGILASVPGKLGTPSPLVTHATTIALIRADLVTDPGARAR
jgi:hypothetical protein